MTSMDPRPIFCPIFCHFLRFWAVSGYSFWAHSRPRLIYQGDGWYMKTSINCGSIDGPGGCLFNIETDPTEHIDLAATMSSKVQEMKDRLRCDLSPYVDMKCWRCFQTGPEIHSEQLLNSCFCENSCENSCFCIRNSCFCVLSLER